MNAAPAASSSNSQRFAHELVHEAAKRGLTYRQIARIAGVSQNAIAQLFQEPEPIAMRGLGRVMTDETAAQIAARLKEALK